MLPPPLRRAHAAALLMLLLTPPAGAAELQAFFAGYRYQFAYGSGVSSSRPRVTLWIQYCPDGRYYSRGQSCRPNLYAAGYQCTPLEDQGQWRVAGDQLQWRSNSGQQGAQALIQRPDGSVTDPSGNPFVRLGLAQCP